jgi:virginiamycin B lyase
MKVLAPIVLALAIAGMGHASELGTIVGDVRDAGGTGLDGTIVTAKDIEATRETTVYGDPSGRFALRDLPPGTYHVRARAYGHAEGVEVVTLRAGRQIEVSLALDRVTDPRELAWQLPANRWLKLALDRFPDDEAREEFKRQCGYCHQQGSWATRVQRSPEEWRKLLALMARMGGILTPRMRALVPETLNAAYDEASYVPTLGEHFAPPAPPSPAARRAVVTEWEIGATDSMLHDAAVAPDGRIYAVDMMQDKLFRLDPATGERRSFAIPSDGLPLGGAFAARQTIPANAASHVGPHSLQIAPDGTIWITLALGNRLARFVPTTERFDLYPVAGGYYPHTLRFDAKGRVWFTLAVSNHIGMLDPATGAVRTVRLPARTWGQEAVIRIMPAFLWLARHVDLDPERAGDGPWLPIPYGIDVAPDGGVWFAQLNERRIGRLDPETSAVELIDTPFPAPRRLRFDSKGMLWIPSFSGSAVARFDPRTREFKSWPLPTEPAGTETPYALNVDRRTDTVWICGTASDSLIRFEPGPERFTVYPMPTKVTYTREIDFDERGAVWTSNSNLPAWQIDGGVPKMIRLEPDGLVPGVGLALEPRDEPAHLVLDRPQEHLDLRMGARRLVDAVGGEEERKRAHERRDPGHEPPAVEVHDLALVAGDRP